MNIPECYDPIHQAEARENEWAMELAMLPRCCFCERHILPGDRYREHLARAVCESCFDELKDSVHVDVEY